jgi:hypothetical protein
MVVARTSVTRQPVSQLETILKLLTALLVVTAASPAWAQSPTKVFPLTGKRLPRQYTKAPEVLARAIAKTAGGEVATTKIEEVAQSLDCDIDTDSCLDSIMKTMRARRIVFGTIVAKADGGATVRLTWFDGTANEQRINLEGEDSEALAESLVYGLTDGARNAPPKPRVPLSKPSDRTERVTERLTERPTEPTEKPRAKEETIDKPVEKPRRDDKEIDLGLPPPPAEKSGTDTLTIGLIAGGAAATLVGAGFLVSANSLKDEVNHAPTATYDDLVYLQSLEHAGKLRMGIGFGLIAAGVGTGAVGVWRLLSHHEPTRSERALTFVPERGGASVVWTMGWP